MRGISRGGASSTRELAFYEDPTKTWSENSFRMSSIQGSLPTLDRMPLPQELLDEIANLSGDPHPATPGVRDSQNTHRSQPGTTGYLTEDGAYSDGLSWCREPGGIDEANPPVLSHSWWEDTIFPKLFPRNLPGGREWEVLSASLAEALVPVTREKDAASAERLLSKVFRIAFHEIYRRLPLFRGAVIHSEQEFNRLRARMEVMAGEEAAKLEELKNEGLKASCAAEVWRDRALRAEKRLEPLRETMARTQQETAEFRGEVCSKYSALQDEYKKIQLQLEQANTVIEGLKAEQERKLKMAADEAALQATLKTNEAIMRARNEADVKVSEIKKKLADSTKEIGEKVLEAGRVAGQVRTMQRSIDCYEKAFKDAGMEIPDPNKKGKKDAK